MDDYALFRIWLNTDFSNVESIKKLIEFGEQHPVGYILPGFNYPTIQTYLTKMLQQDLYYAGEFTKWIDIFQSLQTTLNDLNNRIREILDHLNGNNFTLALDSNGINDPYLVEVNEKIKEVNFSFYVKGLSEDGQGVKLKLTPNFQNLEELLYFQLAQMINTEAPLITCSWCGKYIENPTQGQLGNVMRNIPAYHPEFCWDEAKRKKDRDRKRRKNNEKESDTK